MLQKTAAGLAGFLLGAIFLTLIPAIPALGSIAAATFLLPRAVRRFGPPGLSPDRFALAAGLILGMILGRAPLPLPAAPAFAAPIDFSAVVVRVEARDPKAPDLLPRVVVDRMTTIPEGRPLGEGIVEWTRAELPPRGARIRVTAWLTAIDGRIFADPKNAENVHFAGDPWTVLLCRIEAMRAGLAERADRSLSPSGAALVNSLVLGWGDDPEWRDALSRAGALHFFAVSGFQLAALIAMIKRLPRIGPFGDRTRDLLLIAVLAFYARLSGGDAAILRAFIMSAAVIGARIVRRSAHGGWALLIAADLLILEEPENARDPGFLLSVAAMAALIWIAAPLDRRPVDDEIGAWLDRKEKRRLLHYLRRTMTATYGATLATAPVTAVHFGAINFAALVTNVLLAPIVTVLFFGGIGFYLGIVPAGGIDGLTVLCAFVVDRAGRMPGAQIFAAPASLCVMVHFGALFGAALGIARIGDRRAWKLLAAPTASLLLLFWPATADTVRFDEVRTREADALLCGKGGRGVLIVRGAIDDPGFLRRLERRRKDLGMVGVSALIVVDPDPEHPPNRLLLRERPATVAGILREPIDPRTAEQFAGALLAPEATLSCDGFTLRWSTTTAVKAPDPAEIIGKEVICSAGDDAVAFLDLPPIAGAANVGRFRIDPVAKAIFFTSRSDPVRIAQVALGGDPRPIAVAPRLMDDPPVVRLIRTGIGVTRRIADRD